VIGMQTLPYGSSGQHPWTVPRFPGRQVAHTGHTLTTT
jgi:hypothetical protein